MDTDEYILLGLAAYTEIKRQQNIRLLIETLAKQKKKPRKKKKKGGRC
jgi:hypothetical protein